MPALALTDHNNLSGALHFKQLAREAGIKPIIGAEVTMENGTHLTLLAKDKKGYANLCKIISAAHLSGRKEPRAGFDALQRYGQQLFALSGCRKGEIPQLLLRGKYSEALEALGKYVKLFGKENFFLEMQSDLLPGNKQLNNHLQQLAEKAGLGVVATNNCHYSEKDDFQLYDILTCVRTLTKLEDVHPERRLNAENYLKAPAQMAELYQQCPEALHNTLLIAEQCQDFTFDEKLFPAFPVPGEQTAANLLRRLTFSGAVERYGKLTGRIRERLEHELDIICRLGYQDYFLLVWDIARFARSQGIRYAGRGSAADSAVAYCLFITEVDAINRGLLFERFMSLERAQQPDIDIDFDWRYRDRVGEYVYEKYGKDRVAAVCTYNTFRARSAVRDLGKVMNFPMQEIDNLAKRLPHIDARDLTRAVHFFPELKKSKIPFSKYEQLFAFCQKVAGFPRFIGTHLGGLVVCREDLTNYTPLQIAAKGVVVTQFDKRFVEDLGLVKLDLLSLRTLAVVQDTVETLHRQGKTPDQSIPKEDKATYQMIGEGHTIGVFQLESPAQRALQARLGAQNMEDIVASLALIRPGPIKGNMVEPFIRRRHGFEPVTYLDERLRPILEKTYGVVLFQEQVIEIATVIAGFTPGEADQLRKVMTHARSSAEMDKIGRLFVEKARKNGASAEIAAQVFEYIKGYASYGFCEAHSAAFAATSWQTAYLLRHHPAEYFASMLNHQPMGYYSPVTLCVEARRRGVPVLPLDINNSREDFSVENGAIRVGFKQVKGISKAAIDVILAARQKGPFTSFADFCTRAPVHRHIRENLVLGGAFNQLHPNMRQLLIMGDEHVLGEEHFAAKGVPDFTLEEKFYLEYQVLGLNAREHMMSLWREKLKSRGIMSTREVLSCSPGDMVKVAGAAVRPHRPPTRSGKIIVFLSLEDEHGLIDVTVFNKQYELYGHILFGNVGRGLVIAGKVEKRGRGVSVVASTIERLENYLS